MLNITEATAHMGKISNNIENHGEEEVTAFDIPVSGILFTREQLNQLLDNPHADRALFNTKRSGAVEPSLPQLQPFELRENYEGAKVKIKTLSHQMTLKNGKIKAVTFDLKNGGNAEVSFKLRVLPENDKQILALLAAQNRTITLDVSDATVTKKAADDKQGDLLDGADGKGDAPAGEEADFEKTAKEQVEAYNRGKPNTSGRGAPAH